MMHKHRNQRLVCFSIVLVLGALMPACGGGGSDNGGGNMGALVATFTPAATPGTMSMAASTSGASFSIQVQVTDVNDFYGAGFHVTFNPASAQFVGFSSSGTVLPGTPGTTLSFNAVLDSPGDVKAYGWITDPAQPAGVDVVGTATLMTLNFTATAATSNNPFGFGTMADRVVKVCPTQGGSCSDMTEPPLTWSGGTMTASQ